MTRPQRTRTKFLPLYLSGDIYTRLERDAEMQDRDPYQHARHLLKQALDTPTLADPHTRVPAEAGAA